MDGALPHDDLGHPVAAVRPARRVVSLVPSLTESVAVTSPGALAGATIWCAHPAGLCGGGGQGDALILRVPGA